MWCYRFPILYGSYSSPLWPNPWLGSAGQKQPSSIRTNWLHTNLTRFSNMLSAAFTSLSTNIGCPWTDESPLPLFLYLVRSPIHVWHTFQEVNRCRLYYMDQKFITESKILLIGRGCGHCWYVLLAAHRCHFQLTYTERWSLSEIWLLMYRNLLGASGIVVCSLEGLLSEVQWYKTLQNGQPLCKGHCFHANSFSLHEADTKDKMAGPKVSFTYGRGQVWWFMSMSTLPGI